MENVTTQDLLLIIGNKEVELITLRGDLVQERLMHEKTVEALKKSKITVAKSGLKPNPVGCPE